MILRIFSVLICGLGSFMTFGQNVMTPEKLWELGRVGGEGLTPDGKNIIYGVKTYEVEANSGDRNLFMVPVKGGEPKQLTDMKGSEYGVQIYTSGDKVGFMNGGHWYEAGLDFKNPKAVAGIEGAEFAKVSPDGRKVLFAARAQVESGVSDEYPDLQQADAKIYDDLMIRHWDTWNDGSYRHLFVADLANGSVSNVVDILEGEPHDAPLMPFGGSEDVTWSPDSKTVVYASKKKTGVDYAESTNSDLYFYNVETRETKALEGTAGGYDSHPSFSPDGKKFAWLGMSRDGYESDQNTIIFMDVATGQITFDLFFWRESITSFNWSNDGKTIYFRGGKNARYQLWSIDMSMITGKIGSDIREADGLVKQVTDGTHNINGIVGEANGVLYVEKQDMNHATEIYQVKISNGSLKQVTKTNDAIYNKLELSTVEEKWVETIDGKQMQVWVIYPPNFDENKKYPAIFYCQGGPQSAISQFYSYRWNFQLMAANDYIVIAPNRRGLPTFGIEWNEEISKDWGGKAMQDYLAAYDQIVFPNEFIDQTKVACVGASFGGYSTFMLAGIHENRFKSFISHCGLFNLESWYGSTEELFFANYDVGGPYWMNNEAARKSYREFSPHKYVAAWNRPMMIIQGGKDFRVPETQAFEAFTAARVQRLKSRLLYFPEENHWVLQPQNGLLWHREFFKWLEETVKTDSEDYYDN